MARIVGRPVRLDEGDPNLAVACAFSPTSCAPDPGRECAGGDTRRGACDSRRYPLQPRAAHVLYRQSPRAEGAKAPLPGHVWLQVCSAAGSPAAGDGWLHEIKHDSSGRLLAIFGGRGGLRLVSRNGRNRTKNVQREIGWGPYQCRADLLRDRLHPCSFAATRRCGAEGLGPRSANGSTYYLAVGHGRPLERRSNRD
jgi:hypothetical protein